jgi:putative capsular polysaccharide synthesis protein
MVRQSKVGTQWQCRDFFEHVQERKKMQDGNFAGYKHDGRPLREVTDPAEFRKKVQTVFVHQIGKVGSTSIAESCKATRHDLDVNHIHGLSNYFISVIDAAIERSKNKAIDSQLYRDHLTVTLQETQRVSKKLQKAAKTSACVITGFRNPLDRVLSNIFQALFLDIPDLSFLPQNREEEAERILTYIDNGYKSFQNPSPFELPTLVENAFWTPLLWFSTEFLLCYNFTPYDLPSFIDKDVYAITDEERLYIFYRFETLKDNLPRILEFVANPADITVVNSNITSEKASADLFRDVKSRYQLPDEYKDLVYNSKYFRHFYCVSKATPQLAAQHELLLNKLEQYLSMPFWYLSSQQQEQADNLQSQYDKIQKDLEQKTQQLSQAITDPTALALARHPFIRAASSTGRWTANHLFPIGTRRRATLERLLNLH